MINWKKKITVKTKIKMGKTAKEHRKKVAARNQRVQESRKKFQKNYETLMKEQFEAMAKNFNEIDNVEVVDMIENGESIMDKEIENE